ncbi:hypothetical protein PHYSODRAFT_246743 [Phytophthora sojae]|uniref:Uncharacterized protein n=1 Tax=Phytophthora sojae (strain P6497) TaxID=1094619 RepID=G4YGX6_PHYSP|nr:hypothetical protein PHYSODRAFT_246743 [Phytophthora sojae]EGZ27457.1 hypothetical protein PHYSODRAFT_246743 [Phytophthora sojae]|eukprot:XP_009514732.1 hypothetical protein PHYSODRAFT_246743 [Phytophthora sojae]
MVSESLSSSSASTIPSVLEISDHEEKQSTGNDNASVNYADEQFESDSDHVDDSADPVLVKSSSSSSGDKYASDEFEDDHEANDPPAFAETLEAEGGENHISTEEEDYAGESFELEVSGDDEQDQVSTPVTQEVTQDTGEQQQRQQKSKLGLIEGDNVKSVKLKLQT